MSTSDDRAARTAASLSKNPSRLKSTISTFVPSAGVRLALYQSTTLRIASLSGPGQYTIRTVAGDWPEICAGMINVTAAQRAKTHPLIVRSRIEFPPLLRVCGATDPVLLRVFEKISCYPVARRGDNHQRAPGYAAGMTVLDGMGPTQRNTVIPAPFASVM